MPQRPVDPSILAGVQHHLDGLKKTPEGALLFSLIERGLERYGTGDRVERAFLQFVNTLLRKYIQDPKSDPSTRFKAKLIQNQLQLNAAPISAPTISTAPTAAAQPPTPPTPMAPMPIVIAQPQVTDAAAVDAPPTSLPPTKAIEIESAATAPSAPSPSPASSPAPSLDAQLKLAVQAKPAPATAAAMAHKTPTMPPATKPALPTDIAETLTPDAGFERLMKQNAAVFSKLGGTDGSRDAENLLFTGLEQLIEGHQQLGANLQRATNYLKLMQTDRDHLRRQLWRARKSSLVDEGTGLANRTALMRQLTAEMSRARRYGGSLALTLVTIDGFETFRNSHGEDIAKHALDVYGTRILRVFRTYDFAARYGTDSFAILFPHTDRDGALRAVEKALMRVANTHIAGPDGDIALPTFSAVIALPSAKEKASSLLRRADEALTRIVAAAQPHTVVCLAADQAPTIPPT